MGPEPTTLSAEDNSDCTTKSSRDVTAAETGTLAAGGPAAPQRLNKADRRHLCKWRHSENARGQKSRRHGAGVAYCLQKINGSP
ncbi:unnamed protein product, partial [Iphiclides podalirius]